MSLPGPSLVLSLVFPTNTLRMSSKSANILFDDMFTIKDVDSARFERGASPIPSTICTGIENPHMISFPSSSTFLKLWNGSVFGFSPRNISIEAS